MTKPLRRSGSGWEAAVRAGILLFWAGMMVALYARLRPPPPTPAGALAPLPAEGSESWQGIYGSGKKIGYAHSRRVPTDGGFSFENRALVRLNMMGASRVVQTHVSAETDPSLALRRFTFTVSSDAANFEARGVVDGSELEVTFAPGERTMRVPLSEPIVLPQTLHDALGREQLETGRTFRYALFDPLAGEPATVELSVGALGRIDLPGGARRAYEVTERFRGSEFKLWVAPSGEVLREEGPLGLTLVREDEAAASAEGFGDGDALDLVAAAAIPAGGEIPSPREASHLTLRLTGAPQSVAFPPRQTADGDRIRIVSESPQRLGTFPLPERDARFTAELASTPFVQSDDPRIRALAREILADETSSQAAARRLVDWVFRAVSKVPAVSVPTALQVLDSLSGDCNEHSVLFTALARAAGLPARIVAGAVYMPPEATGPGAFYYHAWVEVWLGEWTAVDPTFGQFPADATHLKLIEGGPEKHSALLGMIGRLAIDVEDFG